MPLKALFLVLEESRKLVGACILSLYFALYFFAISGSGLSDSPISIYLPDHICLAGEFCRVWS